MRRTSLHLTIPPSFCQPKSSASSSRQTRHNERAGGGIPPAVAIFIGMFSGHLKGFLETAESENEHARRGVWLGNFGHWLSPRGASPGSVHCRGIAASAAPPPLRLGPAMCLRGSAFLGQGHSILTCRPQCGRLQPRRQRNPGFATANPGYALAEPGPL